MKNLKMPKRVEFKPLEECIKTASELPFDPNMSIYDFDKMGDNALIQLAFENLGDFVTLNKRLPSNWDHSDANKFV